MQQEDKERLRNDAEKYALSIVPVARGDAQRQIQDAKLTKKSDCYCKGEADRFEALLIDLPSTRSNRERLYLDALESFSSSTKVMIDVEGGNNLLYLPIDQIMKKAEDDE